MNLRDTNYIVGGDVGKIFKYLNDFNLKKEQNDTLIEKFSPLQYYFSSLQYYLRWKMMPVEDDVKHGSLSVPPPFKAWASPSPTVFTLNIWDNFGIALTADLKNKLLHSKSTVDKKIPPSITWTFQG